MTRTVEKSNPIINATFEIFNKLAKVNNCPTGENSTNLVILLLSTFFWGKSVGFLLLFE
jgi:hypothetical protein